MTNEEFIQSVALLGEEWKEVPGLEDVCIASSYGRIISKGRYVNKGSQNKPHLVWKEPKLQKIHTNRYGYHIVNVCQNGIAKPRTVHQLVARAFIPNPLNKPNIDHIDTIVTNNNVSNLRWCTQAENCQNPITREHTRIANTKKLHTKNCKPILAIKDGIVIKNYKGIISVVADGYNSACVFQAVSGRRKTYKGMIWMYLSDYESLVRYFKELSKNSRSSYAVVGGNVDKICNTSANLS